MSGGTKAARTPGVSVGVPVYSGERFLVELLSSGACAPGDGLPASASLRKGG